MAEATAAKGKVCNVKGVEFKANPPKHEVTRGWPLVNPKSCPGAQLEFHITEIQPEGGALDDVHEKEDHVFYVLSGRAMAKVGDDDFLVEPGDALYVPKNTVHNFRIQGGEVFRIAVVFAPARDIWG
ncbi:MAG: cupin domain-containing protein [Thermoleophilia bacterium]|jgi:mannose-6-phosphate isomerase-like protein (cupin superfamily)